MRLGDLVVEEATPEALGAGDLDVCLFSVGAAASRELVPHAARAGALCVDKSSAFRLQDGVPLVVPEVNGERAADHSGIVANPNCCSIPLSMVLAPLRDAAGLRAVRVATYQSAAGAGAQAMERLREEPVDDHDLRMDWDFDGVELDEESKIRAETRKILELPDLPVSATCVRVPVLVGHAEAVWVETVDPLSPHEAEQLLAGAPGLRLEQFPTPLGATGLDEVLVGRIRTRSRCRERARPLPRLRQPAQGRGTERIRSSSCTIAELPAADASSRPRAPSGLRALGIRARGFRSARPGRRRRGRRLERVLDDLEHLLPRALLDGLEPPEIEPRQLDPAGGAHGPEPEVGQEVAGKDRSVHEKPLRRRRALPIAVRERLERADTLVSGLSDRCQEEGLLDPRL